MSQLLTYYRSFQNKSNGPNQAPTFEDLAIDDELSELQRVVTYTKSSIGLQRCVFARGLCFSAVLQGCLQETRF